MKILGLILALLFGKMLEAQSFTAFPAAVLDQELSFNQANECFIYFDHPAADTLHLKWRQLEVSLPEGWTVDLCDYGLCYTGIPANGTMNPAYDTVRPYLKLIVQPNTTPGSAWLWFRAAAVDNNANYADVYFNLFTPGTTGISTPVSAPVRTYPNPVGNTLFIENNTTSALPFRLTDGLGREIRRSEVPEKTTETIDVSPYPAGIYWLQTHEKTDLILKQY